MAVAESCEINVGIAVTSCSGYCVVGLWKLRPWWVFKKVPLSNSILMMQQWRWSYGSPSVLLGHTTGNCLFLGWWAPLKKMADTDLVRVANCEFIGIHTKHSLQIHWTIILSVNSTQHWIWRYSKIMQSIAWYMRSESLVIRSHIALYGLRSL